MRPLRGEQKAGGKDGHCDAEGHKGESHEWQEQGYKRNSVKAAQLSSSNALSSLGRKGRENNSGHTQLITNAGHIQ